MTLTSKPLAVIIVVTLFGGILFSSALGWWQTENTKTAATYTEGQFAGQANPADIRGSYTLADIERNFGVPVAVLAQAFGVTDAAPEAFQVKSLEALNAGSPVEIGTASVRLFVAFYLGLPVDLSTNTYLPASAVELLQVRPLTPEQAAYLAAHTAGGPVNSTEPTPPPALPAAATTTPAPAGQGGPAGQGQSGNQGGSAGQGNSAGQGGPNSQSTPAAEHTPQSAAGEIKGKTTFADLLAWGLPQETIEQILGTAMPADTSIKVKDFCTANGLSFEPVKSALQAALDALE
ncbi:MAG TPA: hypothetical protein PKM21_19095 [Anaerolineales bacterium]|nr:hypothetical protein [Anaerolineales bacterium]